MLEKLFDRMDELYPSLVEIRRHLHMHPELSHHEVETPKMVAQYLTDLGLEVKTGVGGRGVVGYLRGGKPGKTVALRADFDALPIQDEKDVPYTSTVPGVMHACGHDLHTATLLGVAKVLSEVKEDIAGTVVFVHQFAEEVTPGGAEMMINDGCLEGVDVIYGAHVMSQDPIGTVNIIEGYASSAQDDFKIEIFGKGGHGSSPHETVDALVTGSQLVVNLQQIVSRRVSPLNAAAVTVASFHSGDGNNIISDKAVLQGTVRTYDADERTKIEEALHLITRTTCEAANATYNIDYVRDCPSIFNDANEAKRVETVATKIFGEEHVRRGDVMMGSEDFAYYQQVVKGNYFIVGGGNPDLNAVYPHHHPMFDVDERAIGHIGKIFIGTVFDFLNDPAH